MSRLLIISNRLPLNAERKDGKLQLFKLQGVNLLFYQWHFL